MSFGLPLLIALFASLLWTSLFSLSSTPGVRGYRNLGILATYLALIVSLFCTRWKDVALTWIVFAVAGGVIYTMWEVLQRVRTPKGQEKPEVGLSHIFPAIVMWPVMIPEAFEYTLAELGILKVRKTTIGEPGATGNPDDAE